MAISMESKQQLTKQSLAIKVLTNPIWIENSEGLYVPSFAYDTNITEDDGKALNAIEWRKLKLTKTNLSKVRLESLKPSDYAYHSEYGYLQLEKYTGPLPGKTPTDGEKEP
jgi:hypothetical protein